MFIKFVILCSLLTLFSSCYPVNDSFSFQLGFLSQDFQILENYTPISLKVDKLEELKKNASTGDFEALEIVLKIVSVADSLLDENPPTVIDKPEPGPNNDFNDYVSKAPYWWPNPDSIDHLPYIRRDGEVNPEIYSYNRDELSTLKKRMLILSISYYLTNDDKYVIKSVDHLKYWFINTQTSMNPHLEFAQGIPGKSDGRFLGIIEGIDFISIIDAISLMKDSNSWDRSIESSLFYWFDNFLEWLRNSHHGIREGEYPNNHGSWYDVQTITYASFTNKSSIVASTLENVPSKRIEQQFEANGKQPHEIARTLGIHYSVYNLIALTRLATFGNQPQKNIWAYPSEENSNLLNAIDYLIPFISGTSEWEYNQIRDYNKCLFIEPLEAAYLYSNDSNYLEAKNNIILNGCSEYYLFKQLIENY